MQDKYNELFNGNLEVERTDHGVVAIGDKDYLFCEIDGALTHEDGKEMQRATYIANATNTHADMFEMLERIVNDAKGYEKRSGKKVTWVTDAETLLAKARGE